MHFKRHWSVLVIFVFFQNTENTQTPLKQRVIFFNGEFCVFKLFQALGCTEWRVRCPSLEQVHMLLRLHRYQCAIESPELKSALRWEWLLAGYKPTFFQHMVHSVIQQLELAES